MQTIVISGGSKPPCGICKCWVWEYPELRPVITPAQFAGKPIDENGATILGSARALSQLTCDWIADIFELDDSPAARERAQQLLEHVTLLSGGVLPRVERSPLGRLQIKYFLDYTHLNRTHFNERWSDDDLQKLPILPGICRNGAVSAISKILLAAHIEGLIHLDSTVTETTEDLA